MGGEWRQIRPLYKVCACSKMCTKWLPTPSDCSKKSLRGLEDKVFSLQRGEAIFFSLRRRRHRRHQGRGLVLSRLSFAKLPCVLVHMLLTLNGSVPSCFLLTADEVSRGSVSNAGLSLALQHEEPLPNYWRGCYPLSPFAMRRSLRLRGDTRMRAFHTKLISGQQVRIVAVGGSVAWGAIHARPRVRTVPAHARYAQWLRTTYPNASVEYINEASPGTTSSFLLTNFDRILGHYPDLLIWDYSTNDQYGMLETPVEARGCYELLARKLLDRLPTCALVFLSLPPAEPATEAQHRWQEDTIVPVAAAYNIAVVSAQDTLWPAYRNPPSPSLHLWDCSTRHPQPPQVQLVADLLAHFHLLVSSSQPRTANAAAEGNAVDAANNAATAEQPPYTSRPLLFASSAMGPCDGGWRTILSGNRSSFMPSSPSGEGWRWDGTHHGNGWLFNASVGGGAISFDMRFGRVAPRLAISFLRSYEHFGRALLVFDGAADEAAARVATQQCYRDLCDLRFPSLANASRTGTTTAAELQALVAAASNRSTQVKNMSLRASARWAPGCPDLGQHPRIQSGLGLGGREAKGALFSSKAPTLAVYSGSGSKLPSACRAS